MSAEKIAITLYVRNEATDIDSWIAWYLALGADKLIIFDDGSTDGTFEIIKSAAEKFDIEYFQLDREQIPNFQLRHREAIRIAFEIAKTQGFDWLGLFDADEYVNISDENLKVFLGRMQEFDAVALNWCIYGSGGRVVKPVIAPPDAFRTHSFENLPENALVKSFVRPEKFNPDVYGGPHRFAGIEDGKYADPTGNVIHWDGPLNHNVDWSHGKVLHFINRSMEHFVERIARRLNADLSDSRVYFDNLEKNDVYDPSPEKFLPKTYEYTGVIQSNFIENLCRNIEYVPQNPASQNVLTFSVEYVDLRTRLGQGIYYNRVTNRVVYAADDYEHLDHLLKLEAFFINGNEKYLHISFPRNERYFFLHVEGDLRTAYSLTYRVEKKPGSNTFFLISPKNNTYIEAEHSDTAKEGLFLIKSGNLKQKETEEFVVNKALSDDADYRYLTLDEFLHLISNDVKIGTLYFSNLLNMLSEEDRTFVKNKYKGVIGKMI